MAQHVVARKKPPGGGGSGKRRHEDHAVHAEQLEQELQADALARAATRPASIDPRAILIVELNRSVRDEDWDAVGIQELDGRALDATVAFSSDVELAGFLDRLTKYRAATPSEKGSLVGAELFDRIDHVRYYRAEDRVSPRLSVAIDDEDVDEPLIFDIEIWHPGGREEVEEARAWVAVVRQRVADEGGDVLDWFTNHEVGVQLLRVRGTKNLVKQLVHVDEIASMDLRPMPPGALRSATDLSASDLPTVQPPAVDAPLFAVIDSGVAGAHPLIGPALYEATTLLPELQDGADEHGHGTAVAGLALHGQPETFLQGDVLTPFGRLLSIRILDADNGFPDHTLWPKIVIAAIEHAAERGCRVINLSIGDRDGAMTDRRATRVAALVDDAVRRLGLVVIVPTGNIGDLRDYIQPGPFAAKDYLRESLASPTTTLLDPAPAALALTVGGLGADGNLKLGEIAMGKGSQPSATSRRGPGVARGIKPELSAPAGTVAWVDTIGFVDRRSLQPLVLSHSPDEVFTRDFGTSYAAPLATRVATAVQALYPEISGPLTRALVLQATTRVEIDKQSLPEGTRAELDRSRLNLVGHGTPSVEAARFSRRDRVVLVAEGSLEVDKVVVFAVPIPRSFFESGGFRTIDLAVCFDPLTRYRRKDYLGSRLFPYLFLGPTAEEVLAVLSEAELDQLEQEDDADAKGGLGTLRKVKLTPSTAASSDSANILLRATRQQRFDPNLYDTNGLQTGYLAIRSTGRWTPPGLADQYGVALAFGHDVPGIDLYEEIRARIDVEIDVDVEVELEA